MHFKESYINFVQTFINANPATTTLVTTAGTYTWTPIFVLDNTNLGDYVGLYFEYKYDGAEIQYSNPSNINCYWDGFNYMPSELADQVFTNGSKPFLITINKPKICATDIL
jgi:hypothetical protein